MKIDIALDDSRINAAFDRLIRAGEDLSPAMRSVAGIMEDASQDAFQDEADPTTGRSWEPLSDVTVAMRGGDAHPILQVGGDLAKLSADYGADFAVVGSNEPYAAMQHFGGTTSPRSMIPGKEIPARPFLGLAAEDEEEIIEILRDHLAEGWG